MFTMTSVVRTVGAASAFRSLPPRGSGRPTMVGVQPQLLPAERMPRRPCVAVHRFPGTGRDGKYEPVDHPTSGAS